MNQTLLVVITALCSGLVATIVTLIWQACTKTMQAKKEIFKVLMSKRYNIADAKSVEALNLIDVVFHSSKAVRGAWTKFLDATRIQDEHIRDRSIQESHLKLLETIAQNIGYKRIQWNNINEYYNPVGLADKLQEESVLRRIQIDTGLAQLDKIKNSQAFSQENNNNGINQQILLEAMKNPEGIARLMEISTNYQKTQK